MPDFTKGKWEMKFEYDYDDNPPAYKIFSTFDTKYGVMEETIGYAYEENDARLIASAPEMFRLLKSVVDGSAFLFDDNGHRIFLEDTARVFKNLLAYIEGKN